MLRTYHGNQYVLDAFGPHVHPREVLRNLERMLSQTVNFASQRDDALRNIPAATIYAPMAPGGPIVPSVNLGPAFFRTQSLVFQADTLIHETAHSLLDAADWFDGNGIRRPTAAGWATHDPNFSISGCKIILPHPRLIMTCHSDFESPDFEWLKHRSPHMIHNADSYRYLVKLTHGEVRRKHVSLSFFLLNPDPNLREVVSS